MKPTQENMTQFIRWLFEKRGTESYLGEKVTMAEHMLQAAYFAGQDGATEKLIVAALLHDVGHFIGDFGDDFIEMGVDNLHEDAGGKVLSPFFPAEVTEPIRLHVAAKKISVCNRFFLLRSLIGSIQAHLGATRRRNERERIA